VARSVGRELKNSRNTITQTGDPAGKVITRDVGLKSILRTATKTPSKKPIKN